MSVYKDFDFGIIKNNVIGIDVLEDSKAINKALMTCVLTRKGSLTRFGLPFFGSNIHLYLGEKNTDVNKKLIENEIRTAIYNYEPRVNVIEVTFEDGENREGFDIYVYYEIVSLGIADTLKIETKKIL